MARGIARKFISKRLKNLFYRIDVIFRRTQIFPKNDGNTSKSKFVGAKNRLENSYPVKRKSKSGCKMVHGLRGGGVAKAIKLYFYLHFKFYCKRGLRKKVCGGGGWGCGNKKNFFRFVNTLTRNSVYLKIIFVKEKNSFNRFQKNSHYWRKIGSNIF